MWIEDVVARYTFLFMLYPARNVVSFFNLYLLLTCSLSLHAAMSTYNTSQEPQP